MLFDVSFRVFFFLALRFVHFVHPSIFLLFSFDLMMLFPFPNIRNIVLIGFFISLLLSFSHISVSISSEMQLSGETKGSW